MTDGKVPMPANGERGAEVHGDGVSDVASHRNSTTGESGGGAYPNPHTGKEERGAGRGFEGGQSGRDYHGPGQLGDAKVDADASAKVGRDGTAHD